MTEYEAIAPRRVRAVTWPDDGGFDALRQLAGADNVSVVGSGVQVLNSEGTWVTLGPGWVLAVDDDGKRWVLTPGAFASHYRPVVS